MAEPASHAQITDAGLKELAELKNLQWLNLAAHEDNRRGAEGTGGTEEPAMAGPGHRYANIKITDAGVEELRKALPNCDIRKIDDRKLLR
jgi:hypothetical protein